MRSAPIYCDRQRRYHRHFLLPALCLLLAFDRSLPAAAKFVGVTVDGTLRIGCMPAQFSSGAPGSGDSSTTAGGIYLAGDGCTDAKWGLADDANAISPASGRTALVEIVEGDNIADAIVDPVCGLSDRVARAKAAGAVGVLFLNKLPGEVPYPVGWTYTDLLPRVPHNTRQPDGIDLPVCLASAADGKRLLALFEVGTSPTGTAAPGATAAGTVDWSQFQRWDLSSEPTTGAHTVLSVLSPMSIKEDWPAAQGSFNPPEADTLAGDVIVAQWSDDCLPEVDYSVSSLLSYYCHACWAAEGAQFANAAAIASAAHPIVLYAEPFSLCFPYFYDLAVTAHRNGAVASVAQLSSDQLPVWLAPHIVPYDAVAPMLALQWRVGQYLVNAAAAGQRVAAVVHATDEEGAGPSFYPPPDYHEALAETDITLELCDSGTVGGAVVPAGQATFNPDTAAAQSNVPVVLAGLDVSCARATGATAPNDIGTWAGNDCAKCLRLVAESSAIAAGSLTGKVAFLWDWQTFCMNSLLDVARAAAAAGAVGVVVGNSRDLTMTQSGAVAQSGAGSGNSSSSGNAHNAAIPMFNVALSEAQQLADKVADTTCAATVSLPALIGGTGPPSVSTKYDVDAKRTPSQARFKLHDGRRRRRRLRRLGPTTTSTSLPGRLSMRPELAPVPLGPLDYADDEIYQLFHAGRRFDDRRSLDGTSVSSGGNSDSVQVLEVGQTLFQPTSHPGFLDGRRLVQAQLLAGCGADSCSRCNLYDMPLTFTSQRMDDYKDAVLVVDMQTAHCIRPFSQYVYFAQQAGADGVLFLSDNREAYLETLGPEVIDFSVEIPSFVLPRGSWNDAFVSVQFPAIVNGVAGEQIGADASLSPISDNSLDPSTPGNPRRGKHGGGSDGTDATDNAGSPGGLDTGLIVFIVLVSSLFCCVFGWKSFKVMHRRHQRGKLHAVGHMQHETSDGGTQTSSSGGASSDRERILVANPSDFTSILADYGVMDEGGSGGGGSQFSGRGTAESKDAFEDVPSVAQLDEVQTEK